MRRTFTLTPFYPEHLQRLQPHPVQTDEYTALLNQAALDNLAGCTGLTAWAGATCVGVAGVFQLWPDRAEAWCVFSEEAQYYLLQAMRAFRYVLDSVPFRRIEMTVKVHNRKGHQIARQLGFGGTQKIKLPDGSVVQGEGLLRAYWPFEEGGTDVIMYSRIRQR